MIDTHCHALFGVDDASRTLEQAIAMLQTAAADGIKKVLTTPHCLPGIRFENTKETLHPVYTTVKEELKCREIPVELYLGCEFTLSDAAIPWLKSKKMLTLNGTDWLLVELPWYQKVQMTFSEEELLQFCLDCGYRVLVAHPERYRSVQQDFNTIKRWRRMGCNFQINRTSLLASDRNMSNLCWQLIESGFCDIIASDAHENHTRTITLSDSFQAVELRLGYSAAELLMQINPQRLLDGKPLLPLF